MTHTVPGTVTYTPATADVWGNTNVAAMFTPADESSPSFASFIINVVQPQYKLVKEVVPVPETLVIKVTDIVPVIKEVKVVERIKVDNKWVKETTLVPETKLVKEIKLVKETKLVRKIELVSVEY